MGKSTELGVGATFHGGSYGGRQASCNGVYLLALGLVGFEMRMRASKARILANKLALTRTTAEVTESPRVGEGGATDAASRRAARPGTTVFPLPTGPYCLHGSRDPCKRKGVVPEPMPRRAKRAVEETVEKSRLRE